MNLLHWLIAGSLILLSVGFIVGFLVARNLCWKAHDPYIKIHVRGQDLRLVPEKDYIGLAKEALHRHHNREEQKT